MARAGGESSVIKKSAPHFDELRRGIEKAHSGHIAQGGGIYDRNAASETVELALHSADRVPISGDEQQHCELRPEGGHPALFDIAAAVHDHAGQFLHDRGGITADGGDDHELFHRQEISRLSQSGSVP